MTREQKSAITFAHSALVDYVQFLSLWAGNRLDDARLITDIPLEIKELSDTIYNLEKEFPHVDPDIQNFN
jgi:hypothetical protein